MFRTQAASETSAEQQIPPSTSRDAACSVRKCNTGQHSFLSDAARSVPTGSNNQASLEARLIWLYCLNLLHSYTELVGLVSIDGVLLHGARTTRGVT